MGKFVDRTGKKYGKLLVIEKTDKRDSCGAVIWLCQCDCGNVVEVSGNAFRTQRSCGCEKNQLEDLTGCVFGRLTVLEYAGYNPKGHSSLWKCQCSCGNAKIVNGNNLKRGLTTSCGCFGKESRSKRSFVHGIGNENRIFRIWNGIKRRCYNENDRNYVRYGGRGITMCKEWLNSFMSFYEWSISNGYADNLSIDRIDNDKGYSPDNCKWSTAKEQANNTRSTVFITYNGETKPISEWSEITGIKTTTLAQRKRNGWSDKECIEIPVKTSNNQTTRNNR